MMNFLRILRFDLMTILRTPVLTINNTVVILVMWWAFGLINQDHFGGTTTSYDYYAVATLILAAILISMTVSNTFMEENVKKPNLRISYTPVSGSEILLSKLLATFIFAIVAYSLIALVEQYVFHSNLGGQNIGYVLSLIFALTFFGCSLGITVCTFAKSEEKANAIMPLVSLVFIALSGIFIPLGHLGQIMDWVSMISPVRWLTVCAFQVICDNNFSLFVPTISALVVLSVVLVSISLFQFKPEDYL